MSLRRETDPDSENHKDEREKNSWCIDHENRIVGVEQEVKTISNKTQRMVVAMFGPNGDPREGFVWKLEHTLDWINKMKEEDFEKTIEWAATVKKDWHWLKRVGMSGALSAIGLFFYVILKFLVGQNLL